MFEMKDKIAVITGGTGSFGQVATRRLLQEGIGRVRIFSRDELKQDLMRQEYADDRLAFHLGDVRDRDSVEQVMDGADMVFHAAALKQVPSCEFFPMQAVQTNVQGSDNVVRSAVGAGVQRVICLGTDKAAHPINTMGMTKALMEKIAQSHARLAGGDTVVATVRYGNVMASRGSVIPLFTKQISQGGPVTVTEPSMTRFMLPLSDAIDLVMFAFEHAGPGDLFVRKAPACTMGDLSRAMRNLLDADVAEQVIGIRHGEKMHETLVTRDEFARSEDLGDYYRIRMDDRDLNYGLYVSEGDQTGQVNEGYTSDNAHRMPVRDVEDLLLTLPEVADLVDTAT